MRQLKERARDQIGKNMMITVAGCVAQAEGAEITKRARVDMVVGPQSYHRLPELIAKLDPNARNNVIDTDMPEEVVASCQRKWLIVGQLPFCQCKRDAINLCILCGAIYKSTSRSASQVIEAKS